MPESVSNELLYEVLKNVQAGLTEIKSDIRDIKARQTSQDNKLGLIHSELAALHIDLAGLSGRMDKLENRMERVEIRLNLNDTPH
jgi:archaellum component FlaC